MPLISQQNVVSISELNFSYKNGFPSEDEIDEVMSRAIETLMAELEDYPPCRIVSLSVLEGDQTLTLTAVVETV